jgi:riboflavin transporter FmnP
LVSWGDFVEVGEGRPPSDDFLVHVNGSDAKIIAAANKVTINTAEAILLGGLLVNCWSLPLNYFYFFPFVTSMVPMKLCTVSSHTSGFHVHMPSIISSR